MKILTPLALALTVLCFTSDPVVAASKISGPYSLIPVAGTTSSAIAIPNLIEAGRRNEAIAIPNLLEAGNGLPQPHSDGLSYGSHLQGLEELGCNFPPHNVTQPHYHHLQQTGDGVPITVLMAAPYEDPAIGARPEVTSAPLYVGPKVYQ